MGQNVTPTSANRHKEKSVSERRFENAVAAGSKRCRLDRASVLCAVSGSRLGRPRGGSLPPARGSFSAQARHGPCGPRPSSLLRERRRPRAEARERARDSARVGEGHRGRDRRRGQSSRPARPAISRSKRWRALAGTTLSSPDTRTDQAETVLLRLMRGSACAACRPWRRSAGWSGGQARPPHARPLGCRGPGLREGSGRLHRGRRDQRRPPVSPKCAAPWGLGRSDQGGAGAGTSPSPSWPPRPARMRPRSTRWRERPSPPWCGAARAGCSIPAPRARRPPRPSVGGSCGGWWPGSTPSRRCRPYTYGSC